MGTYFFAWLHFVSLLFTVGLLFAEWALYRPGLGFQTARLLPRLDALYGLASLTLVGSGFSRALWFEKGWEFYSSNPLFWAKVFLVTLWAAFSLVPTFHFMAWGARLRQGQVPEISLPEMAKIRRFFLIQMSLIPIVPFLAVLMARGVGL